MDLDMPRGYAPCWLDESPPKVDIDQKENSDPSIAIQALLPPLDSLA